MFIKHIVIGVAIIFSGQVLGMMPESEAKVSASQARVRCPFCEKNVKANEAMRLGCGHSFCYNCLLLCLKLAVHARSTRPLKCLIKTCSYKFSVAEIDLIENRGQQATDISNEDRLAVQSPALCCDHTTVVLQGKEHFGPKPQICPQCHYAYCENCYQPWEKHVLNKHVLPCESLHSSGESHKK